MSLIIFPFLFPFIPHHISRSLASWYLAIPAYTFSILLKQSHFRDLRPVDSTGDYLVTAFYLVIGLTIAAITLWIRPNPKAREFHERSPSEQKTYGQHQSEYLSSPKVFLAGYIASVLAFVLGMVLIIASIAAYPGPDAGFAALGIILRSPVYVVFVSLLNLWLFFRKWRRKSRVFLAGLLVPFLMLLVLRLAGPIV